jgi:hypothetical protein
MIITKDLKSVPDYTTSSCLPTGKYKCYEVSNPRDIQLQADRVTDICTNVKIITTEGYVIRINNHLCNKPWRPLIKFLSLNEQNQMLTVPVIVSKNIKLKAFEPLCHISFVPITFALGSIKGKLYIYYSSFFPFFFISKTFYSVFFFQSKTSSIFQKMKNILPIMMMVIMMKNDKYLLVKQSEK